MSKLLIIDDDVANCRTLQLHFNAQGHDTRIAHTADEGMTAALEDTPELIILDIRMPGKSGLEALPEFKQAFPNIHIVMITAFHDMESTIQAMQRGADDYIHKPIDIDELDATVARILIAMYSTEETLQAGSREGDESAFIMVGHSKGMKEVFKTIGLVAASPATILITGESGTGKELVARAIHRSGSNPNGPFVAVNCAALVETLLESEMFGHEKGAFTGAVGKQAGKFALARGGTIFLDEISEMSPAMQAKLLRVIQDKEFTPLGATKPEFTDARIIAATNVDLSERVSDGDFREDLFYRLQVVNIHLPPLRERMEDILDLVQHLLARINHEMNRNVTAVAMDAINCFQHYKWPGNVRELENVLRKAVALCPGKTITIDLLPTNVCGEISYEQAPAELRSLEKTSLYEMEKMHVARVLAAQDWHKGKACEVLGISRPRLRRMIREFELVPPNGATEEMEEE